MRRACALVLLALACSSLAQNVPDVGIEEDGEFVRELCSNADGFTMPQMAKAMSCSKAFSFSKEGGVASAWANSNSAVLKVASEACSDAVSNATLALCGGADPVAAVYSMATACASACATLQVSTVSGAEVDPGYAYPAKAPSKKAFNVACGDACGNAEASASAMAQASACAFNRATAGCSAVTAQVRTAAFAEAFVKTGAEAWAMACAKGYGAAHSQGNAIADSMVKAFADTFGDVVASACTSCNTCKCAALPKGWTYKDKTSWAEATEVVSQGRYALAKVLSNAQAAYCRVTAKGNTVLATADAAVDATLSAVAEILMTTLQRVSGVSSAGGEASLACSGGSTHATLKASKKALTTAVVDVASLVYGEKCPKAVNQMKTFQVLLDQKVLKMYRTQVRGCAVAKGGKVSEKSVEDMIDEEVGDDKTLQSALAKAFVEGKACGCKPATCTFCATKEKLAAKFPPKAPKGTATAPPPAPAYTAPANPGDGQPVPSNGNTYNLNGVVTGPQQG